MAERAPQFLDPSPPPLPHSSSSSLSVAEPPTSNPAATNTTINLQVQTPQQQQQLVFESGTYIVQVPKDQIYRVPPPENAIIAQRYRDPEQNRKNRALRACCCCSPFLCCSVVIAIIIIIAAITVAVSFLLLKPKNPEFQIQRLVVGNHTSYFAYDVSLIVHNVNKKSGVSYNKECATSVLSFGKNKLASGKFPSFQQHNGESTPDVRLALRGKDGPLPQEVEESIKGGGRSKAHVSLSLDMNVPVRMKTSSFKTDDAVLVVTCDFTVDTLARGTNILSQECQTERR